MIRQYIYTVKYTKRNVTLMKTGLVRRRLPNREEGIRFHDLYAMN